MKHWKRTPKQQRGDCQTYPRLHPHWKSKTRQLVGRQLWKAYRQHERTVLHSEREDLLFSNPYWIVERVKYWD